jgi:protein-disulfide isomerase
MPNRERVLDVLTVIAVLCAVITTSLVIRRESSGTPVISRGAQPAPTDVKDWKKYVSTGRMIGNPNAPLVIVEFADFQCPACRMLKIVLDTLRTQRPNDLAVSYHYFPLSYHPQAYPAARAAECAADQGRFEQYHNELFNRFDSLSARAYQALALRVGVGNMKAFNDCISRTDSVPRISRDKKIAVEELHIRGTPTTIINGKMYAYVPPPSELKKILDDAKALAAHQ